MTGSTPNRGYPFPTPDSPNKPRLDIEALADAVDTDVQGVADNGTQALNDLAADLREYIHHEIIDLQQDLTAGDQANKDYTDAEVAKARAEAKTYTDAEVAKLEQRLTALIESSVPDTSQLPVLGPWAIAAKKPDPLQPLDHGFIAGNGAFPSTSDYADMRNWRELEISLLDSSYHSDHHWQSVVADDWVIVYNGGLHTATWRAKSAAQRNGDESVIISVEWVDGTTTDPADLGTDGFIHAPPESTSHFPI